MHSPVVHLERLFIYFSLNLHEFHKSSGIHTCPIRGLDYWQWRMWTVSCSRTHCLEGPNLTARRETQKPLQFPSEYFFMCFTSYSGRCAFVTNNFAISQFLMQRFSWLIQYDWPCESEFPLRHQAWSSSLICCSCTYFSSFCFFCLILCLFCFCSHKEILVKLSAQCTFTFDSRVTYSKRSECFMVNSVFAEPWRERKRVCGRTKLRYHRSIQGLFTLKCVIVSSKSKSAMQNPFCSQLSALKGNVLFHSGGNIITSTVLKGQEWQCF